VTTMRARLKLREARYFLRLMCERDGSLNLGNSEEMGHLVSAFLSAARSIPGVLATENQHEFKANYARWKAALTPEEHHLHLGLSKLRDSSVHQGEMSHEQEIVMGSWASVPADKRPPSFAVLTYINEEEALIARAIFYLKVGLDRVPVLEACEKYRGLLERLVVAFED
jgi:hypothetical protein